MNTVLIHGQNHKGSSYHIGRLIADKIKTDNNIIEFFLPRDLEHFCVGCYRCVEDEAECPFYVEKRTIMNQVEKADLLIFTTPVYCLRASAPMKSFIDLTFTYWISHKPRKVMFGKKAIVVSTAAGAGTKSAMKDISNTLFYWGVPYVKHYGISVQAMTWDGVSDNKKAKIEKDTSKLANTLLNKRVKVGIKMKFMFNVMRMMQKADFVEIFINADLKQGSTNTSGMLLPLFKEHFGAAKTDLELKILTFQLLHPLQILFLNRSEYKIYLSCDLSNQSVRDNIIETLVDNLLRK